MPASNFSLSLNPVTTNPIIPEGCVSPGLYAPDTARKFEDDNFSHPLGPLTTNLTSPSNSTEPYERSLGLIQSWKQHGERLVVIGDGITLVILLSLGAIWLRRAFGFVGGKRISPARYSAGSVAKASDRSRTSG